MMTTKKMKSQTINTSVVDKLPNTRNKFFAKSKGDRETHSMTTDQAKKADDDISYRLDEQSTIEEEDMEHSEEQGRYLEEEVDVMSMSANSSCNFSFATYDTKSDAYPALYDPEQQAEYEKMKIEEKERKEREKRWAPVMSVVDSVKTELNTLYSYFESFCSYGLSN